MFVGRRITPLGTPEECHVPTAQYHITPERGERPHRTPYYKHATPSGVAYGCTSSMINLSSSANHEHDQRET